MNRTDRPSQRIVEPRLVRAVRPLQRWADDERAAGRRIALVPTMGALHAGHLSLVRRAMCTADRVVVSIFVNPTQFGPNEDFDSYPRNLARDMARLRSVGCDIVFAPGVEEVYPDGDCTSVSVSELSEGLCGSRRPGHFDGVTTVVARLLLAAKPHVALFGEKDFQQLAVIRRMARDLHFDVRIEGAPTVREPDGLAMSSRNAYLTASQREQARALNGGLVEAGQLFRSGERSVRVLTEVTARRISKEPEAEIDYVELRCTHSLRPLERLVDRTAVLAIAVRFGETRLIDNTVLEPAP